MKIFQIGVALAITMVATPTVWGQTTPPPAQLVANLQDPMAHPAGTAGYGQKTDMSGKITASFLNAQIGPLSKDLVGKKVNVSIDKGPDIAVTVVLDKSGKNGAANLSLNSANKDKVPLVKVGSTITVSTPGKPPLAQGKFASAK